MQKELKRTNGELLFTYKEGHLREAIEIAVKNKYDLQNADLRCADLEGANLYYADLQNANLEGADLSGATLSCAHLGEANLEGADLSGANLYKSYFNGANLSGADLSGATIFRAYLNGANLSNAVYKIPFACPASGEFYAYKKVRENGMNYIIKLKVPADAKRCSATGTKCRCDKAMVVEIKNMENDDNEESVSNISRNIKTIYKVGEMVYPDSFDDNRWNECSNGIHFFMDEDDARNYIL